MSAPSICQTFQAKNRTPGSPHVIVAEPCSQRSSSVFMQLIPPPHVDWMLRNVDCPPQVTSWLRRVPIEERPKRRRQDPESGPCHATTAAMDKEEGESEGGRRAPCRHPERERTLVGAATAAADSLSEPHACARARPASLLQCTPPSPSSARESLAAAIPISRAALLAAARRERERKRLAAARTSRRPSRRGGQRRPFFLLHGSRTSSRC